MKKFILTAFFIIFLINVQAVPRTCGVTWEDGAAQYYLEVTYEGSSCFPTNASGFLMMDGNLLAIGTPTGFAIELACGLPPCMIVMNKKHKLNTMFLKFLI